METDTAPARRYVITDVFSDQKFQGNPLAVVLDAEGLTPAQMQAIAIEFNYSETTFVLPPDDPARDARVRIFTPSREVPFAGHPNIGTAFVLAREAAPNGRHLENFLFEEAAGLVPIRLLHQGATVIGAELTAPEPLSRRSQVPPEDAAACLSLTAADIRTDAHPPQVVSVGLPFLVVELASRDALRRASSSRSAYDRVLPLDGATSVYAYTHDSGADADLQARMFTTRMTEDPATGSATAAMSALLAELRGTEDLSLRIRQGVDMGRPSTLLARVSRQPNAPPLVRIGGHCVLVMAGTLSL